MPVGADRMQDEFIIPLGYGNQVDWLQNVLAAGRAAVSAEGRTWEVTAPEVTASMSSPARASASVHLRK